MGVWKGFSFANFKVTNNSTLVYFRIWGSVASTTRPSLLFLRSFRFWFYVMFIFFTNLMKISLQVNLTYVTQFSVMSKHCKHTACAKLRELLTFWRWEQHSCFCCVDLTTQRFLNHIVTCSVFKRLELKKVILIRFHFDALNLSWSAQNNLTRVTRFAKCCLG